MSLLSCVIWMCYDTLQACKIKQDSHRRNHTYLSCDFHCFIYARTWRADAWDTVTHTLANMHIYTTLKIKRVCVMVFFHTKQHVLVYLQGRRYSLDMHSIFRLLPIFFSLCYVCVFSDESSVLKSSSSVHPTFTNFSVFATRAVAAQPCRHEGTNSYIHIQTCMYTTIKTNHAREKNGKGQTAYL